MFKEKIDSLEPSEEQIADPSQNIENAKIDIFAAQLEKASPDLNQQTRDIIAEVAGENIDVIFSNTDATETFIQEASKYAIKNTGKTEDLKNKIAILVENLKNEDIEKAA